MVHISLPEVLMARLRVPKRRCVAEGAVVSPQRMEGVPDEVCDRFRRCLQALSGDLSMLVFPTSGFPF